MPSIITSFNETGNLVADVGVGVGVQVLLGAVGVVMSVVGGVGNSVVVVLVLRTRAMRSAINLFLAAGAICDAITMIFLLPMDIISLCGRGWLLPEPFCYAHTFISSVINSESALILVIICLDRYLLLVHSQVHLTQTTACWVIAGTWTLSICQALPSVLGVGGFTALPLPRGLTHCLWRPSEIKSTGEMIYACVWFCTSYLFPVLAMLFCFACILAKSAKVHTRESEKNTPGCFGGRILNLKTEMAETGVDNKHDLKTESSANGMYKKEQVMDGREKSARRKSIGRRKLNRIRSLEDIGTTRSSAEETRDAKVPKSDITQRIPQTSVNKIKTMERKRKENTLPLGTPFNIHIKYKKRKVMTILALSLVLIIFRSPLSIILFLHSLSLVSASFQYFPWLQWLAHIQPVIFPVIYAVRIRKFREELLDLFPWLIPYTPKPKNKRKYIYMIPNDRVYDLPTNPISSLDRNNPSVDYPRSTDRNNHLPPQIHNLLVSSTVRNSTKPISILDKTNPSVLPPHSVDNKYTPDKTHSLASSTGNKSHSPISSLGRHNSSVMLPLTHSTERTKHAASYAPSLLPTSTIRSSHKPTSSLSRTKPSHSTCRSTHTPSHANSLPVACTNRKDHTLTSSLGRSTPLHASNNNRNKPPQKSSLVTSSTDKHTTMPSSNRNNHIHSTGSTEHPLVDSSLVSSTGRISHPRLQSLSLSTNIHSNYIDNTSHPHPQVPKSQSTGRNSHPRLQSLSSCIDVHSSLPPLELPPTPPSIVKDRYHPHHHHPHHLPLRLVQSLSTYHNSPSMI